jgi:hypothetical protein
MLRRLQLVWQSRLDRLDRRTETPASHNCGHHVAADDAIVTALRLERVREVAECNVAEIVRDRRRREDEPGSVAGQ